MLGWKGYSCFGVLGKDDKARLEELRMRSHSFSVNDFMWNKYCKKEIPALVKWKGGSQLWKKMLEVRDEVDRKIWWEPNTEGQWIQHRINDHLPQDIAEFVVNDMEVLETEEPWDHPWWMATELGRFTVKSS
ncbi:hypothetical protein HAX54_009915 [Datura stramonium]|uniref:Uncharacterized protein n=1 Tax=Datura stramonium TaxID=4076 RepID=A0ABS8RWT3_DATST|nr:hypothetical protein [Datura stramonium]